LTATEHNTTQIISDVGAQGDSEGDILTFANEVFDADDKNKIGTDNGVCTGGTGEYAGAQGEMALSDVSGGQGKAYRFVYRIK